MQNQPMLCCIFKQFPWKNILKYKRINLVLLGPFDSNSSPYLRGESTARPIISKGYKLHTGFIAISNPTIRQTEQIISNKYCII